MAGLAVLVMARAPRAGETKVRLEPMLGRDGCVRLGRALVGRTAGWGAAVADSVHVAFTPDDARAEIAPLVPPGADLFAQEGEHLGARLATAFARVAAEQGCPVLVVGTDQPTLGAHHAWAAADDLRAGVDVTLGPATDGGYYLLGAPAYREELFAVDADAWGGPHVMDQTLRSVLDAGLSIGWLRSERGLHEPGDAAALLADPCTPPEIAAALRA